MIFRYTHPPPLPKLRCYACKFWLLSLLFDAGSWCELLRISCNVNRVKELNKDVARRALKHAVVKNASITSTTVDSARSCRSVTPPSPCCHTSLSYDVLPTTPCDDLMTKQLTDIFAHCLPPSEAGQQHVCDDQITPYVDRVACSNDGLPADQGAYFLPLSDSRLPHRQKTRRRRESTLDDIDESLDETALFHSRHSVLDHQQSQQPIIAWPSDDECDDFKDEVEVTKQQRDVHEVYDGVDSQTQLMTVDNCTDTGKHQSTRSLNSEPAVSLHQHRPTRSVNNCTPVAGGVQSDFVLSSTTRHVTGPLGPREAVCKMRTEGDRTACCPLSSTVCSRLNDCVLPADMSGDCHRLQSTAKVSSKLNDVGVLPVGDVYNGCMAMNTDLTCYRLEQVVQGKSNCKETTRARNNVSEAVRTSAGKSQTVQTTTDSRESALPEMAKRTSTDDNKQTQTQARRESGSKQMSTETSRSQVPKTQQTSVHDDTSVSNNRSGWESSPDTVKLLAMLINKISELATRQDQLEGTSRCVKKDMSVSQSDERRRETEDESGLRQVISTEPSSVSRANNRQQSLQANLDDARQSGASRQDESLLRKTRKERCASKSQKPEQKMNNGEQTNNVVREELLAVHSATTNDDASEPSKLNNSSSRGQQSDDVNDAVEQQQQPPPAGSVQPSPSSAVTDNIIHIVRGSRALDDLTVEELRRHYGELFPVSDELVAHGGQPVKETETSTEAHSQPLDQAAGESLSRANNEPPQRYHGSHVARQSPGLKSQQPKTTQDDRQVSRRPRSQQADNVSTHHHRDPQITQDDPQQSTRPRRRSMSPKDVANSASLRQFTQPYSKRQPAQGVRRPRTERYQQKQRTSFNTSDDHAKLRMQYVDSRFSYSPAAKVTFYQFIIACTNHKQR